MDRLAKASLRKAIAQRLKVLSSASLARQSDEVVKSVLQLPQYQAARRVSVFLSMPIHEIQTRGIVLDALRSGKTVFVPYIEGGNSDMRMYRLDDVKDYESLATDKWGIPSLPKETLARREIGDKNLELVLVPAVAFSSKTLDRLGHGKGYYDRFISDYEQGNEGKAPLLVGLALLEQILPPSDTLPVSPHDHAVDMIITGQGKILKRES